MDEKVAKYLKKYSKTLIDFEKSVNALHSLVGEIDRVEGTSFFNVLRNQSGFMNDVSGDVSRILDKVLLIREICERLKTDEPPSGIILDRGKVEG